MLIRFCLKLFVLLIFVIHLNADGKISIMYGGGYTARICLNSFIETNSIFSSDEKFLFKCNNISKIDNKCKTSLYSCKIPCKYEEKIVKINKQRTDVKLINKLEFKLSNNNKKSNYESNDHLYIDINHDLVLAEEIKINFFANISCSRKQIINNSIICQLNLSQIPFDQTKTVNISMSYGYDCKVNQFIGNISITNTSKMVKLMKLYYWVPIIILIFMFFMFVSILYSKKINKRRRKVEVQFTKKQIKQENDFSNIQHKAFFEYQVAIPSLNNIGKLTSRHLHSFHIFMIHVLNVKLEMNLDDKMTDKLESFKSILLDKEKLIKWIDKVENECRVKQKCLVASFLTLYLFHHPQYFIDVMKKLLRKLILKMKENSEENLLFCKSEFIVEKMICYWITLCLYDNLRTSDIGGKFFNLCRGIKSKMDTGVVDMFTNNAKFALTFDNLLMDDFTAKQLTVRVNVKIHIRLMDSAINPMEIDLDHLNVNILSLDSVSQVKLKIIDKAIITFTEMYTNVYDFDSSIAPLNHEEFILQYYDGNIAITLNDFDTNNKKSNNDKNYIMVNTMKHYHVETGCQLFLSQAPTNRSIPFIVNDQSIHYGNEIPVHVQLPQDITIKNRKELNLTFFNKIISDSFTENTNKHPYLFTLLATKQCLDPLIYDFMQSIIYRKPKTTSIISSNAIYKFSELEYINNVLYGSNDSLSTNARDNYLKIVDYLFSMLYEIGNSLSVDNTIIKSWQNKSFILQIWVNLIKNPNFIFSIDKTIPIHGSLITIAKVLMESCSDTVNTNDLELPLTKQLFMKDVDEKYSKWWKSFLESSVKVDDTEMISILSDIVQKNYLSTYKIISLKTLQMISPNIS